MLKTYHFKMKLEKKEEQRTKLQNKALHKFFELLAEELNEKGLDMKVVLSRFTVDVPATKESVKEVLWKGIQRPMFNKEHTSKLNTKEVTQIYETLNRLTSEQWHFHIPFPSINNFLEE